MTKNQKDFVNMVLANGNFTNANSAKSLPANLWLSKLLFSSPLLANHYFQIITLMQNPKNRYERYLKHIVIKENV
ncbi:hypothetical protein [Helicobacter sp. T3_23-1056]